MSITPIIIDGPAKGEAIQISRTMTSFVVPVPREVAADDLIEPKTLAYDLLGPSFDTEVYMVHWVSAFGRMVAVASLRLHLSNIELFDALLPAGAGKAVLA